MSKASDWAAERQAAQDVSNEIWSRRPKVSTSVYLPSVGTFYVAVSKDGYPLIVKTPGQGLDQRPEEHEIRWAGDIINLLKAARYILDTFGEPT